MKRSASGEVASASAKKQKTTPLAAYQQAQEHLRAHMARQVRPAVIYHQQSLLPAHYPSAQDVMLKAVHMQCSCLAISSSCLHRGHCRLVAQTRHSNHQVTFHLCLPAPHDTCMWAKLLCFYSTSLSSSSSSSISACAGFTAC